jgi:hypothetical protein
MKSKIDKTIFHRVCPVCAVHFSTTNVRKIYHDLFCTSKGKLRSQLQQRTGRTSNVQDQVLKIMRRHRTLLYSAHMVNERGLDMPLSGIGSAMKGMCKRGILSVAIRGDGQRQKTLYQLTEQGMTYGK